MINFAAFSHFGATFPQRWGFPLLCRWCIEGQFLFVGKAEHEDICWFRTKFQFSNLCGFCLTGLFQNKWSQKQIVLRALSRNCCDSVCAMNIVVASGGVLWILYTVVSIYLGAPGVSGLCKMVAIYQSIFYIHFLSMKILYFDYFSLKWVPINPIKNKSSMVAVMAWRQQAITWANIEQQHYATMR